MPERLVPLMEINDRYNEFYEARRSQQVYATEFVVRSFLGTYPSLKPDRSGFDGRSVLDLGFGDGRNMPLLCNLGFDVYGVEITDEICDACTARMSNLGYKVANRCGRNNAIPFGDQFFDHVVACHACYYVDDDSTFNDNMKEIARVLVAGGRLVFSVPMPSSYIVTNAVDTGNGHMRVTQDPYGVRNGSILKCFRSSEEIETELANDFEDFRIGTVQNNWWGIQEDAWTVVCYRRAAADHRAE